MSKTNNQAQNNPASAPIVALNPAPGEIQLLLIRAENVPQGRLSKRPVYVSITDGKKNVLSSKLKVKGGAAMFNENITGIYPGRSLQLTIVLKEKHYFHDDKDIHQFFLPIQEMSIDGLTEITLPEHSDSKSPVITLRAAFMPLRIPKSRTRTVPDTEGTLDIAETALDTATNILDTVTSSLPSAASCASISPVSPVSYGSW